MLTDLDKGGSSDGLSKRAKNFFDQDIFRDIDGLDEIDDDGSDEEANGVDSSGSKRREDAVTRGEAASEKHLIKAGPVETKSQRKIVAEASASDSESDDDGFEVVKRGKNASDWESNEKNGASDKASKYSYVPSSTG